jgi:hypothetical protein
LTQCLLLPHPSWWWHGTALLKASLALTSSTPLAVNTPTTTSTVVNPDVKPIPMANFDQDLSVPTILQERYSVVLVKNNILYHLYENRL